MMLCESKHFFLYCEKNMSKNMLQILSITEMTIMSYNRDARYEEKIVIMMLLLNPH